jgi:uncharacterized protein (UPF0332 family)
VTDENRRHNLELELERAEQALRAAEALLGLGLCSDSVSRAYYGVFHCLRALLLSRGLEARTHSGAIHMLNVEFVRTGKLSSSYNRLLASAQRARELADYDAAVTFSSDDARAQLDEARGFETAIRVLLASEGWIPAVS